MAPAFKDQYVLANGLRTRYWSVGQGGTPLVFLHGLGGTIEDWAGSLMPFAAQRRVIAIDLLGNGRTEFAPDGDYSLERMRDHALAALDALSLDAFDLLGWSLGGRIALDIAHIVPQRIRRLVLVGPAGVGVDTIVDFTAPLHISLGQAVTGTSSSGWRLFCNALRHGGASRLLRFARRRMTFIATSQARNAFLAQLQSFVGKSGYLEGPRQELLAKLPQIDTPTLAIWGRQDNFAPFEHSDALVRLMPNCALEAVEGCGHTVHIERPEIFVRAVDQFLR